MLDYALSTEQGTAACERFVEMLGLKPLFAAFVGRVSSVVRRVYRFFGLHISQGDDRKKNPHATSAREDEEHLMGVLASLFTNLPSDSAERIRVVAKFVEGEYAKVERLLEIREGALGRLRGVDAEIAREREVSCR